jgi:hypothetical protein
VLVFFFTHHSCFIGITDRIELKCSSLSFLTLSDLDCLPNSEHPPIFVLIVCVAALEFLLSLGKPNGPVWNSGLFGFPVLEPSCPAGGRHSRNGRLLCSSLRGQIPQHVLTISDGSVLAAESTDCTTPPKVDKTDTSSTEAPQPRH